MKAIPPMDYVLQTAFAEMDNYKWSDLSKATDISEALLQ